MRTKKNNPFNILILASIIIIIPIIIGIFYYQSLFSPLNPNGEIKAFVVEKGDGASVIAEKLEKQGFIKSALAFKIAYKSNSKPIEVGDFKLSSAMSINEIIQNLTEGPVDRWITLVEGIRVEEMAGILNSKLGVDKAEFLKHAKEGYMFPDTYLFNPDSHPSDIASIMQNTFDKKYTSDIQAKIKSNGLTPEQGVILASIVEREARSEKVRKEVAGVYLNRLRLGMKLDIDATVQYAKDSQKLKSGNLEKFWQPIIRADYTGVISPYNTYLNNGLPPAPICNPSLTSLEAVGNPTKSDYLYYYHDPKGNSHYAKTLEQHNANVAQYR